MYNTATEVKMLQQYNDFMETYTFMDKYDDSNILQEEADKKRKVFQE